MKVYAIKVFVILAVIGLFTPMVRAMSQFDVTFSNETVTLTKQIPAFISAGYSPFINTHISEGVDWVKWQKDGKQNLFVYLASSYVDAKTSNPFGSGNVVVLEDVNALGGTTIQFDSCEQPTSDVWATGKTQLEWDMMIDAGSNPTDPNGGFGNVYFALANQTVSGTRFPIASFAISLPHTAPVLSNLLASVTYAPDVAIVPEPLPTPVGTGKIFPIGSSVHVKLVVDLDAGSVELYLKRATDVSEVDFGAFDLYSMSIANQGPRNLSELSIYSVTETKVKLAVDNVKIQSIPTNCAQVGQYGQLLKGDMNGDCKVDFKDVKQFAAGWLSCNNPAGCN